MAERQAGGAPAPTLHDQIIRIAQVVVNVSDLERARAFYEAVSPLRVVGRTRAPAQEFAGLGIEEGEFDGLLLDDGTGGRPTAVHLVQWRTPAPVGRPYPVFWHRGLAKLGFVNPDADAKLAQVAAAGVPTTNEVIVRGYVSVLDPDGTVLSFYHDAASRQERLLHTNPSVADVDRSIRFYEEILGLDRHIDSVPDRPMPSSQGPGADESQWDSHLFAAWGDRRFSVDVSQFHHPPPSPETSTPYQEANHLGIQRVVFEVHDVDAAHEALVALEAAGEDLRVAGPPESWDYGGDLGVQHVVCFRDPDGVRLEFVGRTAPPRSTYLDNRSEDGQ